MTSSSPSSGKWEDSNQVDEKKMKKEQYLHWSVGGILADTIAGFISWSIYIHLPFLMYFFPCVKMAFSGWESILIAYASPVLLSFQFVRKLCANHLWLFRLLGLFAFASIYIEDERQDYRIGMVGVAMSFDLLGNIGYAISADQEGRDRMIFGHLLGLLVFTTSRMVAMTLNPAFHYQFVNSLVVVLGILGSVLVLMERKNIGHVFEQTPLENPPFWFRGTSIYAIFFMTLFLFTERSVIPRWTELPPFPHGILVLFSLFVGLSLSFAWKKKSMSGWHDILESFVWFFIMGLGGALFFAVGKNELFPPYIEFAGGCMLSIYGMSVWFPVLETLSQVRYRGLALFVGFIIYIMLVFWSAYVTSYKFMPEGWLLRERNISHLFFTIILIGLGHVKTIFPRQSSRVTLDLPSNGKKALLFFLVLVLLPASCFRWIKSQEPPKIQNPTEIKPLVWAVHFGYDNYGDENLRSLVDVIQKNEANVIGLVETDTSRVYLENRDLMEYLSESLHFYSDYGPSTSLNTFGCGFLSLFPIIRTKRIILPSPEGELSCLIDAYILVNDTEVNVIVTHFGNTEDKLDRKLQAEGVANLVKGKKEKKDPTLLIGYLTADPWSENWKTVISSGLLDTTSSYDRYCLYIMYRDLEFLEFKRVDKGDVSDTEAQTASFLLKSEESLKRNSFECREATNSPVQCQANPDCVWCQLGRGITSGFCANADYAASCISLDGVTVGSIGNNQTNYQLQQDLLKFQYDQHRKGLYPVINTGDNKFEWKITNILQLDADFMYYLDSTVFEALDRQWRINLDLPNKSRRMYQRGVGVMLELFDGEPISANFKISFSNHQQEFHHNFSKKSSKKGATRFCTFQNVYSSVDHLNSLTVKLEFI